MKKCLVVKHHIPVPGYGTLTPGEVLNNALICLLEDEQIERLLHREALAVIGDDEEWEDDADSPDEPPVLPDKDALEEPEAPVPTDQDGGQEEPENDSGDEADAEEEPPEMDATESIVDAPAPEAPKAQPQPHKAGGYKRGRKRGDAK